MRNLSCTRAHVSPVHFLLMLSCLASNIQIVHADANKLMVILLDGFRWDYYNKPNLPGFANIFQHGVRADYSLPVFPSMSYPNYYSIMTGLYPENHGIMLNYMYDPSTGETFSTEPYWWEQAEPFWITATKAGLLVDMYLWPGCEVPIKGVQPNFCIPYSLKLGTAEFSKHMRNAVDKFANDEIDIALVYCEQPDLFGHVFGPDSLVVDLIVRRLDAALQNLQNDIENHGMKGKVDVIIISDHGMAKKNKHAISLRKYINKNDIEKTVDLGVVIGIYPNKGKLDKVYKKLSRIQNTKVWKKDDIPEEFHYKNNIRTSPIILLADPGYSIQTFSRKSVPSLGPIPPSLINLLTSGYHGYDTNGFPDMRGIFLAFGPSFRNGEKIPPIKNLDVYNLMMNICGLEPRPNNGTWANVVMSLNRH